MIRPGKLLTRTAFFISVLALLMLLPLASAVTAKREASVSIWCARDAAPSSRIRLVINSRNAPIVHVTATPIDGVSWIRDEFFDRNQGKIPPTIARPAVAWDVTVALAGQVPNPNNADTYYSRQINLPRLRPGVYLVHAKVNGASAWSVVNVTNLAVVVKRSPKRALVWVTDALTGKLEPGARVTAYRSNRSIAVQGQTGADGATMLPISPGQETFLISKGADLAGVSTGAVDPDGRLVVHFQTDRPIYRPGQTVSFKAILRRTKDIAYSVVANQAVGIELRDPKDDVIDIKALSTNRMGTVQESFDIPSEAMPGPCSSGESRGLPTVRSGGIP